MVDTGADSLGFTRYQHYIFCMDLSDLTALVVDPSYGYPDLIGFLVGQG